MAVYTNRTQDSPVASIEFTPVSDGNFTFLTLKSPEQKDSFKQWLTSRDIGQSIIAETQVDGKPVLVTHGDKTKEDLVKALEARGDKFERHIRKKAFSERAWQTGATLALIGQGMQLASSFLRPDRKADWSLRMLAIPNLIATTWILMYGAQRSPDVHRMDYLKNHFNKKLDEFAPDGGAKLPGIHEARALLRKDEKEPPTLKERTDDFLKRYSVVGGEILLRYLGAFSLAFAPNRWKGGWKKLKTGDLKGAYNASKTPSGLTHAAGLLSLTGKTVALTSKAPDPFNPKPHTWIDTIREKFTFRTGGWIETLAFGMVAFDGFTNKNKKISFRQIKDTKTGKFLPGFSEKNQYQDFISGIGGTLFTIRYIIRHWAPFGIKDMNMDEMYAHVTDSLAQMPPDKLPQLMADTAADLTSHFKDKHLEFGKTFTRLTNELYSANHIALDNLGTEPAERVAKLNGHGQKKDVAPPPAAADGTLAQQHGPRNLLDRVDRPAPSHTEGSTRTPATVQPGIV